MSPIISPAPHSSGMNLAAPSPYPPRAVAIVRSRSEETGNAIMELNHSVAAQDWRKALRQCHRILARDPEHLGALEVLAQAQWFCSYYPELIETATKLLRLNPLEPGYRYTRGMAYLAIGDLNRAVDDLERAQRQSPDELFRLQIRGALQMVRRIKAEPLSLDPKNLGRLLQKADPALRSTVMH